jgi:outer membrane protein OmpA-like peptidoglycan-associated protein
MKSWIVGLSVLSLVAGGAAMAKERSSKKENIGVATGFAVGAAAGGPVGAILGAATGAWMGNRWHRTDLERDRLAVELDKSNAQVAAVTNDLDATRQELADADKRGYDLAVARVIGSGVSGEVLFRTSDAGLADASAARLKEVGRLLASLPGAEVRLEGFADPRGKSAENLTLSEKRALAVKDALVAGGFAAERVAVEARGESQSTAKPDDPDGLALERKVVIMIGPTAVDGAETAKVAKSAQ